MTKPTVRLEDFQKLELVTARILDVEAHPQADKLYVIRVDTGSGEKRIVAGIRSSYPPEQLKGRTIILVNNLEPAVIRGVASEGMLLATRDGDAIRVIVPDQPVPPGSIVK